jgi:hypothetical protein
LESAQVVAVVLATREHLLSLEVAQQVVVLLAVAVVDLKAMEQVAHAVRQVLAVTDLLSSTKYLHNEQGMRHTRWHSPQHYRSGSGRTADLRLSRSIRPDGP